MPRKKSDVIGWSNDLGCLVKNTSKGPVPVRQNAQGEYEEIPLKRCKDKISPFFGTLCRLGECDIWDRGHAECSFIAKGEELTEGVLQNPPESTEELLEEFDPNSQAGNPEKVCPKLFSEFYGKVCGTHNCEEFDSEKEDCVRLHHCWDAPAATESQELAQTDSAQETTAPEQDQVEAEPTPETTEIEIDGEAVPPAGAPPLVIAPLTPSMRIGKPEETITINKEVALAVKDSYTRLMDELRSELYDVNRKINKLETKEELAKMINKLKCKREELEQKIWEVNGPFKLYENFLPQNPIQLTLPLPEPTYEPKEEQPVAAEAPESSQEPEEDQYELPFESVDPGEENEEPGNVVAFGGEFEDDQVEATEPEFGQDFDYEKAA